MQRRKSISYGDGMVRKRLKNFEKTAQSEIYGRVLTWAALATRAGDFGNELQVSGQLSNQVGF